MLRCLLRLSAIVLLLSVQLYSQIQSAGSGNWSDGATWVGGIVPAAAQSVEVLPGHTVYINTAAECLNLTIKGIVGFDSTTSRTLNVFGNLLVDTTGTLRMYSTANSGAGTLIHQLAFYKSIYNNGIFDMRTGSNPNVGVGDITFTGNDTSYIKMGAYSSSNNEFNKVVVNKTGSNPIVLLSNVESNNNSTTAPSPLMLTRGIIETGNFYWANRATSSGVGVQGGSDSSYVRGTLIRYFATGSNMTRVFQIGDNKYRPLTVTILSGASNSPFKARIINGDANTGTSTFAGNIDRVSMARYYELTNLFTTPISFTFFSPSYREDDGVTAGNKTLRVATALDNRNVWTDRGPDSAGVRPHITSLPGTAVTITSDSIGGGQALNASQVIYIALAKVTGSIENPIPVELKSFSASVSGAAVNLVWKTATEVNNRGFVVQRKSAGDWIDLGFVAGSGTTSEIQSYSYSDLPGSGSYEYRLKQVDLSGRYRIYDPIVVNVGSVPTEFALSDAYPNPFNPSTTVTFSVAEDGNASLRLISVTGAVVRTVFEGAVKSGDKYNLNINASDLSSGVYYIVLSQGGNRLVKPVSLIK